MSETYKQLVREINWARFCAGRFQMTASSSSALADNPSQLDKLRWDSGAMIAAGKRVRALVEDYQKELGGEASDE